MKKLSVFTVLILSLLLTVSCGKTAETQDKILYESTGSSAIELGTGNNYFDFFVTDAEGTVYNFHIHTDKTIVGEALEELGLLEGSEGEFGLYVNKVNGIYAEYEKTGTYWAFYIGNEYAAQGIDMTEIESGKTYSLRIEE